MKSLLKAVGIGLLSGLIFGTWAAHATLEAAAPLPIRAKADFEAPLAGQGTWLEVKWYGHCWRPACVAAGWRPYCNGRWIWSECGWYWQSEEPWGWACYHYGYWVDAPEVGWVWVPDVEWGPAWVSWRYGGGFAGWAPLPPPRFFFFAREAAPSQFAFVAAAHFSDPIRPRMLIVNNIYIINMATQTFNVSKEFRVMDGVRRKVAVNNGPGVEAIEKATGRNFAAVSIEEAARRARVPSGPVWKVITVEGGRKQPFPSGRPLSGRAAEAAEKSNPPGALSSLSPAGSPPMQTRRARGNPGHP